MGQDAVNNILEGLKIAQARRARQAQTEIEQQRLENERQGKEDEIKIRHETLDEQKKQWDAANKAAVAKAALDHVLTKQQISANIMQGIPIPGETVTPDNNAQGGIGAFKAAIGGGPTVSGQEQPGAMQPYSTTETHTFPVGDSKESVQVPLPEMVAQRQAKMYEITNKPKEETLRREKQAEEDSAFKKAEAGKASDFARKQMDDATALVRERETRASTEKIAAANNATQLQVAKISHSGLGSVFGQSTPEQVKAMTDPIIQGMTNGTVGYESVKKMFADKGMAGGDALVTASFMKNGMVPPSDKQVDFNKNVKPIVDSLPLIEEYINMLPKTTGWLGGQVSGIRNVINTDLDAKLKEIKFNIATVAKNLSGDQGQRLQKALLEPAEGGYLPSKSAPTTANVANYNKLIDVINSTVDSALGSLTPDQRNHIKANTLGLSGISKLNKDGSRKQPAPAQGQPTVQQQPAAGGGATLMWTPQGVQPIQQQQPQQQPQQ